MAKPELIAPIVHLNGTSKESLLEARQEVYDALNEAYRALREIAPNGRDYYVKPGLMEKAVEQHRRRQQVLDDLMKEIEAEMEAIDGQT